MSIRQKIKPSVEGLTAFMHKKRSEERLVDGFGKKYAPVDSIDCLE